MKLIPIWAQAAIVAVILAVTFGAGWKVASWRASGKMEKATAAQAKAEKEAREAVVFRAACIEDVKNIKAELVEMVEARAAAELEYAKAVARPPDIVVEYQDRWHTIRDVIVSEDCTAGLGELFDWIHTLPAYAAAGGAP